MMLAGPTSHAGTIRAARPALLTSTGCRSEVREYLHPSMDAWMHPGSANPDGFSCGKCDRIDTLGHRRRTGR
jgi:hypothetical protein